jgi:hypothetical protein
MSAKLADIQRAILDGIINPAKDVTALLKTPPRDNKETMLGVYRHAYGARLQEFLANDHEKLKCYMGESAFAAMARAYIAKHPSDQPNARWYARHLPEFLGKNAPFARTPELSELATLERALNDAFDAPEAPHMTFENLATMAERDFSQVSFVVHPSCRRFATTTNVTSLWSSLRCGETPPRPYRLDALQQVVVWRQDASSRFRLLGDEEAMALDKAIEGLPFGVICEMIAVMDGADTAAMRAATYLRGWIEAQLISSFKTSD